jgi:large subunit ribosomal protein L23
MPALHIADVLKRPLITEKNTTITPLGQYTFEVAMEANKIQIKEAVEKTFDVTVLAVNTLIVKPKKRRVFRARNTTRFGSERAMKKAVVTLAPGDTINIFGDL